MGSQRPPAGTRPESQFTLLKSTQRLLSKLPSPQVLRPQSSAHLASSTESVEPAYWQTCGHWLASFSKTHWSFRFLKSATPFEPWHPRLTLSQRVQELAPLRPRSSTCRGINAQSLWYPAATSTDTYSSKFYLAKYRAREIVHLYAQQATDAGDRGLARNDDSPVTPRKTGLFGTVRTQVIQHHPYVL